MSIFSKYFMVLAMTGLAGCAAQQGVDPAQPTASATTAESAENGAENSSSRDDPDELICRREQVTGTNFRRRVCMTRAERDQMRIETQEGIILQRSADRTGI